MLKSMDMGKVPVDVEVDFEDMDGESYTEVKRFYLNVMPGVPEVEVTLQDWEFIKELIEEEVERSLIRLGKQKK